LAVEDLSDIEREEQLRTWWRDNWAWLVGGIALGLAALGGWNYWKAQRVRTAEAAHTQYVQAIEALGRNDAARATELAGQLASSRGRYPYADQIELALARAAMDKRDLDSAARHLETVASSTTDAELRRIAQWRLARVRIEQGKPDEALALVAVEDAGAFAPHFHEVRGDALAAKGDAAGARKEYEAALAGVADGENVGLDRAYVELKRDALAVAPADPASPGAAQ
jgi:predicted negative regulator of RcsB-dependent stress response